MCLAMCECECLALDQNNKWNDVDTHDHVTVRWADLHQCSGHCPVQTTDTSTGMDVLSVSAQDTVWE